MRDIIYRPLCYWECDCASGFVIGVDFGLFESVWLVVLDEDCAEGLCW